jgi:histidinol-phosphate phosphatase family protein
MRRSGSAVLLDRDGTIIVDRGYLSDPEQIEFEAEAVDGLARLATAGLPLVIVSNQSGIGRGYFDETAANAVNARLATILGGRGVTIAGWYVCPHAPDACCDCRKPAPGLALRAARELDLDLGQSWVIGDKRSDLELADAIGARGILVSTGEGEKARGWATTRGLPICASLKDAAELILENQVSPASSAGSTGSLPASSAPTEG